MEREQVEETVAGKVKEFSIYFKSTLTENPIPKKESPLPTEKRNQYNAAGQGVESTTNSTFVTLFTGKLPA